MEENIEKKKIDALLQLGLALIDERETAISDTDIELNSSVAHTNKIITSTESLLTLIILAIDGRVDAMLKEADSIISTKQVL